MFGEVQLPLQVLHTALTYPATLKEKHKEISKQPQNKKNLNDILPVHIKLMDANKL